MNGSPEVQELLLRINASTALLERELKKADGALDGVGKAADKAGDRLANFGRIQKAIELAALDGLKKQEAGWKNLAQTITLAAQSNIAQQRSQQMALRNLGFQIGDIGTSLAGGASPFLVLAQQGGQVAGAMAGLSGVVGRLGAFLTGPLGAALLTIGTLLGTLWFKSRQATEATEGLKDAQTKLRDATKALDEITGRGNKTLEERARLSRDAAQKTLNEVIALREKAKAELAVAEAQQRAALIRANDPTLAGEGGFNPGAVAAANFASQASSLRAAIAEQDKAITEAQKAIAVASRQIATGTVGSSSSPSRTGGSPAAARAAAPALVSPLQDFLKGGELERGEDFARIVRGLNDEAAKFPADAFKLDDEFKINTAVLDEFTAKLERTKEIQQDFNRDLSRGLADAIVYGDNLGDVLVNSFKRAAAEALSSGIFNLLTGGGGSRGGGVGGFLASLFGGGRASGGPVEPGKFYRVGERGEEWFAPKVPGTIIPNHAIGGMGGGYGRGMVEHVVKVEPSPLFVSTVVTTTRQVSAATTGEAIRSATRPRLRGGRG